MVENFAHAESRGKLVHYLFAEITALANYQDMLRRVLKTLPAEDRIAFLAEVWESLSDKERRLISGDSPLTRPTAPTKATTSKATKPPVRGPVAKAPRPEPVSAPTNTTAPTKTSEELSDEAKQALIEAQFKQFSAKQQMTTDTAASMRKQLVGCMGLGLLALFLFLALSVGGKQAWDFLMSLMQ